MDLLFFFCDLYKSWTYFRVRLLENHEKHRGTKQRFSTLGAIFPSMRIGIFISVIRSLLSWILKHVLLSYLDDYFPGFLYLSSTFKHSFGRFTSTLCANKIKSETEKNPVFFLCSKPKTIVAVAIQGRRVCSDDDSWDSMRVSDERHTRRGKFTSSKFRQNNRWGRFYCRVECSSLYDVCRSAFLSSFYVQWTIGASIERSMSLCCGTSVYIRDTWRHVWERPGEQAKTCWLLYKRVVQAKTF